MNSVYFDYNATTPLLPQARDAWLAAVDGLWLNPSSPYRQAARVHACLTDARERVADLFEVDPGQVVFNSGATEGNNSIFAHWAATLPADARVGVSPTEHPSVLEAAIHFFGKRIDWLALDTTGAVDVTALDALLCDRRQIHAISVMAANNETGILNDWSKVAASCRAHGVQYHCDASQWIGKLPLRGLGDIGYVTGCAHKFGGPRGAGFSILPKTTNSFRSLVGGAQESGHRAGTEDVAGILAMVAALESVKGGAVEGRDAFLDEVTDRLPSVEWIGAGVERLWNTVLLIMPEFANTRWVRALEKRGFLVSAGAACSTGKQGPSPALAAMGLEADKMRRAIRVSSGWNTSLVDWQALANAMVECYAAFRSETKNSTAKVISI